MGLEKLEEIRDVLVAHRHLVGLLGDGDPPVLPPVRDHPERPARRHGGVPRGRCQDVGARRRLRAALLELRLYVVDYLEPPEGLARLGAPLAPRKVQQYRPVAPLHGPTTETGSNEAGEKIHISVHSNLEVFRFGL